MSTIKKSDIVEDKDIVKAFNDINDAIKKSSKATLSLISDFNALRSSLKAVKGFDQLIASQKQYDTAQQLAIKTQTETIKSQQQELKLREATAKAVNNATKEAEKAAKDLAKETSLYAQKSKALNEQRAAAKELGLQYGVNSKQFQNAAKEVNKLDTELKNLDASLGQHQRNVGNYEKVWNLAVIGWAAAGSAIVGAGKYILDLNVKFEKASSSLRAITGASVEDMKFYEAQAKSMGASMGVAGDEMLKSFERVGSIRPELLKMKEALVEVTESAIILSQASGGMLDLAGATESLGAGMNQFNLTAKDSSRIINTLAAGSQAGSAEVSSLTESFKAVGAVADNANMSLEDTVAALEVLGEKSLYGAEAGTKLRGTILKLQEAGKGFASGKFNLKDALTETKAQFDAIANPIERATYLQKMFGIENQTAGIIMLNNIEKYTQFQTAVTGTNVAFEQQKIQMDNISGSWAKLSSEWDSILQSGWFSESIKWIINFGTAALQTGFGFKQYFQTAQDLADETASKWIVTLDKLSNVDKAEELARGIKLINDEIAAGNNIDANNILLDVYSKKLLETNTAIKENIIITNEQSKLSKSKTVDLLVSQTELIDKSKTLQEEISKTEKVIGFYDIANRSELETTKLKIKAIDQEIAARNKLEVAKGGKDGVIELTEEQIKKNLEAAKKYKAESDKIAEDFFSEWERVEKINIKKSEDAKEQKLKDEKAYQDASLKQQEDYLDEAMRVEQIKIDKEKEQAKVLSDTKKKVGQDAWNTGKQLVDTMFAIEQNNYDKEATRIEDKYDLQENLLKKQLDNDKLTVESRAQIEGQLKAIEAKKAEELKAIEAKKRESQRKQFIINKAIAVAEIGMNTAQAVMATYKNLGSPWGIPFAIAVGAIGAVQAGLVMAQPIPEFDKGTENAPNTPFLVGEKGAEFVEHKGKTQLVTEPTVMTGMGGAKITSRVETQKILQSQQKDRVWSSFNKNQSIYTEQLIAEQKETNRLLRKKEAVKVVVNNQIPSFADIQNSALKHSYRKL